MPGRPLVSGTRMPDSRCRARSGGEWDGPVPPGTDFSGPSVAGVYDYLAGGYDNFRADREEAARLLEACPGLRGLVRESCAFLGRAVTWAAGQGIAQFLGLGTGTAHPAVRESARAVIPGARVAYVGDDVMACSDMQALLAAGEGVQAVRADLADPAAVLGHQAVRAVIDPAEPVCVILAAALNLMPAARACEVIAGYVRLIAPGSCAAISCARFDDPAVWKQVRAACTAANPHNHTPRQIAGFLAGLEAVPPGLVAAQGWRGGWRDALPVPRDPACMLAAVARKSTKLHGGYEP